MKRILITLLALAICSPLTAQRFSIFKCSEGVAIKKRNSTEWVDAVRRDNVSLLDVVNIPAGGNIAILDATSNRIYKSSKTGESAIKLLIDDARNEADNIALLLNSEIQQSRSGASTSSYSSYGAMQRGDGNDARYEALCNALIYVALNDSSSSKCDISANIIVVESNEIAFEFENNSNNNLYFNILRYEPHTGKFSICYTFERNSGIEGYIVGAQGRRTIQETIFANDINTTIYYIPFATKEPIDSRQLQLQLQGHDSSTAKFIKLDSVMIGNSIKLGK